MIFHGAGMVVHLLILKFSMAAIVLPLKGVFRKVMRTNVYRSSGYGRRLMFRRSWVQIPATYTGWTFSHMFVVKIVMFQKTKINEKEAGNGPF